MPIRDLFEVFNFSLEVTSPQGARLDAFFSAAGPLTASIDVIEYREAGSTIPIKDPGPASFAPLTLSRGLSRSRRMYDWALESILHSSGAGLGVPVQPTYRRNLVLRQHNRQKDAARLYHIIGAFPIDFEAGDWDNSRDDVIIEKLTLAYDYFIIKPGVETVKGGLVRALAAETEF